MKIFALCFAVVFLEIICAEEEITKVPPKKPHSECGVEHGGHIVQKVTMPVTMPVNPHWSYHLQKLYFVDQKTTKVCMYDIHKGELTEVFIDKLKGKALTLFIPIKGEKNTFYLVTSTEIKILELLYKDGLVTGYNLDEHKPISNEKDLEVAMGRTDCEGRLLYGTHKTENSNRTNTDLMMVQKEEDPVAVCEKGVSTQIAFCKDYKKIYVMSSKKQAILEFDYDSETGYVDDIDDPPVVFNASEHHDEVYGKIVDFLLDTDHKLWIAFTKTGTIIKYNCESKKIEEKVIIPEKMITGLIWGGKKMDILFVTTSHYLMDTKCYPNAGSTYAVSGLKATGIKHNDIVL